MKYKKVLVIMSVLAMLAGVMGCKVQILLERYAYSEIVGTFILI